MVYIATAEANLSNSRFEKSLALLTSRFMDLLQQSPTGILDIKEATEILQVPQAQRRRIYDITNVLEGVGLIEKTSKQCIRWKGARSDERSGPEAEMVAGLNKDIEMLNQHERMLDMQLAVAQQNLMNTVVSNIQQAYVTLGDLCGVFPDNTLVTVKAPSNTDMDLNQSQVHLKAVHGRINAMMVEKDDDNNILAASVSQEARPVVFGAESLAGSVSTAGGFRAKRKAVAPNGPPSKRSRLYGASEDVVEYNNLMEEIENLDKDVFSYSPQSSSYSPQSSLGGDYVTFNMGSVEAESPTFSIESLEEGSTKFSFDSASQGFNSSPESSFEGVNRAGMTERYVDSLDTKVPLSIYSPMQQSGPGMQPRTFATQNGSYSNPPVSSNSFATSSASSPGMPPFGSMTLAPPPTRPRTIISARPVTIGSRIMSSRPVSSSQQNTILATKPESSQQPSSFTVSTSSLSPQPGSVTVSTSDSSPGLEQSSSTSPPADFNKFDDNELDLLMKAVQELDADSSPEKDAMESEAMNTFSLDYLGQDAFDLGDTGDMFDNLQKNNVKKSSVIVQNKSF